MIKCLENRRKNKSQPEVIKGQNQGMEGDPLVILIPITITIKIIL